MKLAPLALVQDKNAQRNFDAIERCINAPLDLMELNIMGTVMPVYIGVRETDAAGTKTLDIVVFVRNDYGTLPDGDGVTIEHQGVLLKKYGQIAIVADKELLPT